MGLYQMLKNMNKKLWHTFVSLELEDTMTEEARAQVLENVFEIDNMYYYVRRFMKHFLGLLVKDYDMYIDGIQYINWIIFGLGFFALLLGWLFIMNYVQKKITSSYASLKKILKVFTPDMLKNNRYIVSYLENIKGT